MGYIIGSQMTIINSVVSILWIALAMYLAIDSVNETSIPWRIAKITAGCAIAFAVGWTW
jgi:hypothetical protein